MDLTPSHQDLAVLLGFRIAGTEGEEKDYRVRSAEYGVVGQRRKKGTMVGARRQPVPSGGIAEERGPTALRSPALKCVGVRHRRMLRRAVKVLSGALLRLSGIRGTMYW
jgi:hypothetical protein